jgi:hypothetical protein
MQKSYRAPERTLIGEANDVVRRNRPGRSYAQAREEGLCDHEP